MTIPTTIGHAITPPEPGLTPKELVARATALRSLLIDQQAETERCTRPSDEVHQACVDAGIYRLYQPRRYGGYEFDAVTYMRVLIGTQPR
jgi:3-hydroxy-9,10-secoandrosta-1,3,5(10)-triene-9,17-dione monooxygenase